LLSLQYRHTKLTPLFCAPRFEPYRIETVALWTVTQIDTLKEQLDIAVGAVEGLEGTLAATRDAASAQETELHHQIRDLQACYGSSSRVWTLAAL
jgi:hypothetical protein